MVEKEAELLSLVDTLDLSTEQFISRVGIDETKTELPDDVTVLLIQR